MKVAKKVSRKMAHKSSASRRTLTISQDAYRKIDALRESAPRSNFVETLIHREHRRREREAEIELINSQYTEEVCRETLRINAEFPIHEG